MTEGGAQSVRCYVVISSRRGAPLGAGIAALGGSTADAGGVVVVTPSALSSQPLNPTAGSVPFFSFFFSFGEAATHALTHTSRVKRGKSTAGRKEEGRKSHTNQATALSSSNNTLCVGDFYDQI